MLAVSAAEVVIPNDVADVAKLMTFTPFGSNAIPVSPVTPFNVFVPVLAAAKITNAADTVVVVGIEIVLNPDARTTSVVDGDAALSEITTGPICLLPVSNPVTAPEIVICPLAAMIRRQAPSDPC